MPNQVEDYRNGGPSSNRATESQIRRLLELKIEFAPNITWLEAKKLIRDYHAKRNAAKARE